MKQRTLRFSRYPDNGSGAKCGQLYIIDQWGQIYDFSEACRSMCLENGIKYVDNDEICLLLKEQNMWAGDGIHLSKSFYKFWAQNLYLAALEE